MIDLILMQRVDKLGQMGDRVTVKPGYARNFLLPQPHVVFQVYFDPKNGPAIFEALLHSAEVALVLSGGFLVLTTPCQC
jgi:hypothetical protein